MEKASDEKPDLADGDVRPRAQSDHSSQSPTRSKRTVESSAERRRRDRDELPDQLPSRSDAAANPSKRISQREIAPTWVPSSIQWLWRDPDRSAWSQCRIGLAHLLEAKGCDGETPTFDVLVGLVIMFNVMVLIPEIDATADCEIKSECVPGWIMACNCFFVGFYTLEVILKIIVYQLKFLTWAWSWLDIFIVLSAYFSLVAGMLQGSGKLENANKLQLFRLIRVARVLRMAKILSKFPTLHIMIRGFKGAMNAMGWGLVVLLFLIVLWAILAVELFYTTSQRVFTDDEADAYCKAAFSTVGNAVLLFFQTLIAGDSWGACALPMIRDSPVLFIVFAAALVSLQLGFTNLILAIIVDQASAARFDDQEEAIKEKIAEKKKSMDKWHTMVDDLDLDQNGSLTKEELLKAMDDEEFQETITMMGMDEKALEDVFIHLDLNSDGNVYHDDFVTAFHRAHTQDPRIYMMVMKLQLSKVQIEMRAQFDDLRQLFLTGQSSRDFEKSIELNGQRRNGRPPVSRTPTTASEKLHTDPLASAPRHRKFGSEDPDRHGGGSRSLPISSRGMDTASLDTVFRNFESRLKDLAKEALDVAEIAASKVNVAKRAQDMLSKSQPLSDISIEPTISPDTAVGHPFRRPPALVVTPAQGDEGCRSDQTLTSRGGRSQHEHRDKREASGGQESLLMI